LVILINILTDTVYVRSVVRFVGVQA